MLVDLERAHGPGGQRGGDIAPVHVAGAGRAVVEALVPRGPRAVAYVACDPAAFARDVATFADLGYDLTALRVFDAFPNTHHVECIGLLESRRN